MSSSAGTSVAPSVARAPAPIVRPTRRVRRYLLAAAVTFSGLIASVAWTAIGLVDTVNRPDTFVRATIPGTASVTVDQNARTIIYYDGRANPSAQSLALGVRGPAGATVP